MSVPTRRPARHLVGVPLVAVSGVVAVAALAACGSASSGPTAAAASPSATSSPSSGGGRSVKATETEFHIALTSTSLKAGTVTFHVENTGNITHALTVDGPGVDNKTTGDIAAGASAALTVTLKAGTYEVYCPVGNHKTEGMDTMVKVS